MWSIFLFFLFGLVFWSFWSVFLQRMDKKITLPILKSFIYGRSKCPDCKHTLKPYNLIPLVSRFRQKGKCEYCKKPISTLYPVLEIFSGLIFALRAGIYLEDISLGLLSVSGYILILLLRWLLTLMLVRDMYTYELHVPARFLSLVVSLISWIILGSWSWSDRYLLSASLAFLFIFALIYYLGKWYAKIRFGVMQEAFGQWDVMLAPVLWYLFAVDGIWWWSVFSQEFVMFMLVFVLGACVVWLAYYGVVQLIHKFTKKSWLPDTQHSTNTPMIPFLPAMIIMYWLVIIWYSIVV